MPRFALILFMLVFGVAQALATPLAVCRHTGTEAHIAALQSADKATSAEAHMEEGAAAAKKLGSLADAAGALGTVVLPEIRDVPAPRTTRLVRPLPISLDRLDGRAIAPLLDPPLA